MNPRPITFDPVLAAEGRADVVYVHLGHPLVGTGLRHDLQQEADAVPVDEEPFVGQVGGVGQPGGELLGR